MRPVVVQVYNLMALIMTHLIQVVEKKMVVTLMVLIEDVLVMEALLLYNG
jgi:hypothetical protein